MLPAVHLFPPIVLYTPQRFCRDTHASDPPFVLCVAALSWCAAVVRRTLSLLLHVCGPGDHQPAVYKWWW